jgi:glyoxylase-like metal-dependent hydrolase (beta-lactamase superfamily II)
MVVIGLALLAGVLSPVALHAAPGTAEAAAAEDGVDNRGADTRRWWDALPRPAWSAFERVAPELPWFEVYRLRPDLYAIYEPGQFEEVISYLILGRERALLFDTGLGIGDITTAVRAVTDLPVWVLNSHSHYDHIGGNHVFERIYGLDLPYTRERASGLPHEAVAEAVAPGWIWKPTPPGFDPANYRIRPYDIDRVVDEGFTLDLGGRTLEVLLTPGHAPDSLCLLDRANRLLFTGDTFYPAPLYTHIPGADFAAYRRSARRLAGLAPLVDHLLPGHNVPWVESVYLGRMANAFDAVAAEAAPYDTADGLRQYRFDGFSILVPEPADPSAD